MFDYKSAETMTDRELLLELHEKLSDMDKRERKYRSIAITLLCILTVTVLVCALILVPKAAHAITHYEEFMERLEPVIDSVGELDFERLENGLNSVSEAAEKLTSLDLEMLSEKISQIDFNAINEKLSQLDIEALNQAISNLNTTFAPLLKLFG